jgi:hypothetical protein
MNVFVEDDIFELFNYPHVNIKIEKDVYKRLRHFYKKMNENTYLKQKSEIFIPKRIINGFNLN